MKKQQQQLTRGSRGGKSVVNGWLGGSQGVCTMDKGPENTRHYEKSVLCLHMCDLLQGAWHVFRLSKKVR